MRVYWRVGWECISGSVIVEREGEHVACVCVYRCVCYFLQARSHEPGAGLGDVNEKQEKEFTRPSLVQEHKKGIM